ncbi:MAG TPA: hypothetical protein VKP69_17590 [Isosphaeraceae bacterium]|nr:hypothetical protein [Isosphaeraceae bacterium]
MDSPRVSRRALSIWIVGLGTFSVAVGAAGATSAQGGTRHPDPAQVVPLHQIAPQYREKVAEVIRDHTFHRQGAPETFPCNPRIYLSLLNEPALTLALWQDLSTSPVRLRQVGPNRYQGADGNGATATWEFAFRSPKLHVLLSDLEYVSPRGNARLDARIVLIVHSGYYREVNGEHWVQHDVEAYVKVDSKGWKVVAKTFRPLLEKLLEDQVREAGWFVSLMGRLVAMYPNWACQVAMKANEISPEVRQRFRDVVVQTRRPGAFTGRPTLAENTGAGAPVQRR